jgi:homoserine O-succinyltransferase/O-acetyltransferase
MSVVPGSFSSGSDCKQRRNGKPNGRSQECVSQPCRTLVIGLLNNMPVGAREATERQFITLLHSASSDFSIDLKFYCLPEIGQQESTAVDLERRYERVESLWSAELDGLIVTGREPLTSNLRDEPYWESFVKVLEWAREKTISSIWSCLAAHAAVLHMDDVQRVRNEQKYCGVFDCTRISDHPIAAEIPARFRSPHSRWNGVSETDLTQRGYQVVTRAHDAGVDCFLKQERSLFLFFQGHPEYQADTLLLEYRRDVGRFLRGESKIYPTVPRGYFSEEDLRQLTEIERQVVEDRQENALARLAPLFSAAGKENGWHVTATTIYRNWLEYISFEKSRRLQAEHAMAAQTLAIARDTCLAR